MLLLDNQVVGVLPAWHSPDLLRGGTSEHTVFRETQACSGCTRPEEVYIREDEVSQTKLGGTRRSLCESS